MGKAILKLFLFFVLSAPHVTIVAQDVKVIEAVYLEKFTRFLTWPTDHNVYDSSRQFVIGVIEDKEVMKVLGDVYSEYLILNKKVAVRDLRSEYSIDSCDMIFIGDVSQSKLKEIIEWSYNKPILMVSHNKGFADEGVHINFVLIGDRLRFEINKEAIEESGIKVSHLLLRQALVL